MGVLSGIDDITGWALLQKNSAAIEKSYAADSSSASDIAYFEKIAPTLTTPAKLLSNYRALLFVTTAYGLGSEVDQTAILQKLMTQDPTSTSSLAQQLSSNAYRTFADAMSTWTPPPFSTAAGIAKVVAGYQESSFQTSMGTDNGALQEATYFTQNAKGLTLLSQVMSDPALLDVVTTALGIPSAFGSLDYTQQVQILKPRLDMSQFATTAGVAGLVTKYLAMDELNKVTSGASPDPVVSLFSKLVTAGSTSSSSSDYTDSTPLELTLSASTLNLYA